MKHLLRSCLTVLASIFYFANLSAQTACLIDSTITYDENDNPVYKTEYSYDAQGRINGTTTYRWENNVLIGDSKTFTVFDGSGRHITDVNYLWDATRNRWIGADSTVTVYTGSNITEKTIYAWDTATDNWIGQTRYTYTYFNNNANKKTLSLEEHWSTTANNWEGYAKTETAYDNAGRTTDNASYTWDGTAWAGTGTRTTYAYNTSGYEIEKITCSWSNGNWVNATKAVTAYDGTSTRKTETANYTWSNNDWAGTGTRTTTEYDNARETLKTTYTWSNGNWVNATKAVTAYDGTSTRKTETANYTWSNNAWVGTGTRTTYEYSNGREILKTTYSWSNGDWAYATKAVTAYDGTSTRKTEIANYTWDNTLNDWKGQGTRTTTTYYTNGLAEYTAQYTWQNNQWTGTTRTYKEYNASKVAILEIKYNWSAGEWIYGTKTTHTYNGSLIAEDATYNYTNSEWVLQEQTLYTYSGSTQITKITCKYVNNVWTRYSGDSAYNGVVDGVTISATYIWDRNNTCWNGKTKTETTYYSGTIIAERITYEWKDSQWTYKSRIATEYDSRFTSKKTLDESYNWSNGMWVTNYKYINQYDDEGHTILEEQYKWDNTNQVEVGFSKTEREYGDNCTTTRSYSWKNGGWVGTTGQTKTKDANGRDIEILDITYYNDQWNNDRKREFVYDNNGHTLVDNTYIWMTVVWAYSSRSEKTYDDDAENKLREELTASYTNGAVQSFSRVTYFYHNDPHYIYQTEEDDICDEALPYTWHGKQLNEAGQLIDTVPGTDIFDTIITFTLTVNYRTYGNEEDTIKDSQLPYIWHNKTLNEAGEIKDTLINAASCDSIITFTLTVLPTTTGTDGDVICDNSLPYIWHGKTLTEGCQVIDTIPNTLGGDSIITFTLVVNYRTYNSEEATIKDSQLPYIWHEKTLTETGEIKDTLTNVAGCDSIVTFNLTVLPTTIGTDGDVICDNSLPYIWHGKTLTESCQVIDTIPNALGGDSIITFTLIVNYRTYGTEEATIKDSQLPYVWNNMELTEGGEHPYTTTNVAGCDSTVTLTLTILPTTYGTEEATIYSNELPYVWHNKTLYAAGEVKDTLVNAAQGDSIITFTLTVINLVKAHKNVPMQIVCPGTVISGRTSSKTITAYTQWIDSVRIEYSQTNLVDSFYHYSAMPYSLSAPDLDESQLNPVCRDYLNLDALKDQVLGYINADALYAPLIEPVTSALEWQIRYDSEEWRGWLNLPVSDTNSILSLRVIIHTDCGDATTEPIEAQIQCQPTALDELYEPFNPDAPAYNLLGQPVSPDYHGVVIQSGHKYIR